MYLTEVTGSNLKLNKGIIKKNKNTCFLAFKGCNIMARQNDRAG